MSAMARSFYAENRRVRNDRIKNELGVTLRYPTYREGLRAIARLMSSMRSVAPLSRDGAAALSMTSAPRPSRSGARCRPAC